MRLSIIGSDTVLSLAIVLSLAALSACGASDVPSPAASPESRLSVVTTIYPITYFTQRVGGDRVIITSIVAPGVEAHDFEPSPADLIALNRASLVVYLNPAFEVWMTDVLRSPEANQKIVKAGELNEAGEHKEDPAGTSGEEDEHNGGLDPHVWLNMDEAIQMVERIRDGLIAADDPGSATYTSNAETAIAELHALRQRYDAGLARCSLKTIVVSHKAYGHLAELYGIEQLGLSGLSPEAESSPKHLADITDRIKSDDVKYILIEPIMSSRLAETVAATTGAALLPLHPLESLTPDEVVAGDDYFTVMNRNLEALRKALECN